MSLDSSYMSRALELARRGMGAVEPNPMVGCVVVHEDRVVTQGWHERFGGVHAEAAALAGGDIPPGATLYVTLEPCCHTGKTPPCTDAIINARIARVVVAHRDPFNAVSGRGIERLESAGIKVELGDHEAEAKSLNAPYLKLIDQQSPWILAKWAMSLDGRIATARGDSQWISGPESRAIVHRLRGRMDAIVVGIGTALHDDPQLTARPAGPRVATRIVLDSRARLPLDSALVRTGDEAPVLVATGPEAPGDALRALEARGCEVWQSRETSYAGRLADLWRELGRRQFTNVLVEGGGRVLGELFDARHVDEMHVFVGNQIIGGAAAPGPVAGTGAIRLEQALAIHDLTWQTAGCDLYAAARVNA